MSDKTALRLKYKQLRSELSSDERDQMSLAIANHTLDIPVWHKQVFHLFLPILRHAEVNTEYLLQILMGRDKTIALSRSDFEQSKMLHFELTEDTKIRVSTFGIPEPENGIPLRADQIDVVFVPLLAFDQAGHRTGYGKGFYDRFLADCRADVVKIGLSFFDAEPRIKDVLPSDVKLDYCVTPRRIYSF